MLTRDETTDLLSYVVTYDNRHVTAAVVGSWQDASVRGRWTFDDAVAAVRDHFATTTAYLMPGHITERIRRDRQQPPPVEQLAARQLEAAPPADPARIADVVDDLARDLGWEREITHRSALAVTCPVEWCRAAPGQQCTRPSKKTATGTTPAKPHPARYEAAAEQQMDQEAQQ